MNIKDLVAEGREIIGLFNEDRESDSVMASFCRDHLSQLLDAVERMESALEFNADPRTSTTRCSSIFGAGL